MNAADEGRILYAAYAKTLEDTPLAMFTDWCEDHDPERAELIRHQCAGLTRLFSVRHRARERELIAANRDRWLRVPCGKCGGTGTEQSKRTMASRQCLTCDGTGDAGGLTWRFAYRPDPTGLTDPESGREPVRVIWDRGFPGRVEVPGMGDCVEPDYTTGVTTAAHYRPADWLRAVVTHHPIMEVMPLDCPPWEYNEGEPADVPRQWGWWDISERISTSDYDHDIGEIIHELFDIMWQEWVESRNKDEERRWLLWDHRQDAVGALAEAIPTWARNHKRTKRE